MTVSLRGRRVLPRVQSSPRALPLAGASTRGGRGWGGTARHLRRPLDFGVGIRTFPRRPGSLEGPPRVSSDPRPPPMEVVPDKHPRQVDLEDFVDVVQDPEVGLRRPFLGVGPLVSVEPREPWDRTQEDGTADRTRNGTSVKRRTRCGSRGHCS